MTDKVNIVLVHGAFGDGSHWQHIIPALYQAGHRVMAAQNPLTSLADDVANTRKLAQWMGGPTLLAGHSYGGAVITGAGHATNVVGLVYIAAFAPAEGESLSSILARTAPPPGVAGLSPAFGDDQPGPGSPAKCTAARPATRRKCRASPRRAGRYRPRRAA